MDNYTIGSDPEGFLYSHKIGKFVPAIGLIGGDKVKPKPIEGGYAVLEDNVMVEYNIPPSDMGKDLHKHIRFMTNFIEDKLLDAKFELRYIPSVVFPESDLTSEKANEFGCEPDFDVWNEIERAIDLVNSTVRFAGGHIHFGYEGVDVMESVKLVKLFDLFVGVPSVLIDTDQMRREQYGQAGSFRFKPYGFEYRTLSNFWVNQHEDLINSLINQAATAYSNDLDPEKEKEAIIKAINTGDQTVAKSLIKKYNINV